MSPQQALQILEEATQPHRPVPLTRADYVAVHNALHVLAGVVEKQQASESATTEAARKAAAAEVAQPAAVPPAKAK